MNTILENPETQIPAPAPTRTTFVEPVADGRWPGWFEEAQAEAWREYVRAPMPGRKDEAWRFSDIKRLQPARFHTAEPVADAARISSRLRGLAEFSARFVIVNDEMIERDIRELPEGVLALSLVEAAKFHGDVFRSYFMRQPVELGSHKFAMLHKSQLRTGVLLYVPAGVVVRKPVEIFHVVEGGNAAVFPHTLVVCAEGASVKVLDRFLSADGLPAMACGVNDLHAEADARLEYHALQEWSDSTLAFHLNSTVVGAGAASSSVTVNLGGNFVRGESLNRMAGEGSSSVMLSVNPARGGQMIDQRALQTHAAPGSSSDLLYHNALDDSARTIFGGLIQVAPGAHRTDAYQKVRNLLLSDDAQANSMPGLEILADQVRCSHGATSGELNDEEMFYMLARGIPAETGRRMIVMGFFNSLLERVPDDSVRQLLRERVANRLGIPPEA